MIVYLYVGLNLYDKLTIRISVELHIKKNIEQTSNSNNTQNQRGKVRNTDIKTK